MKRLFLIIVTLLIFLSACGGNELTAFAEDFNQSARKYDTTELIEDEFGEIEEEDGEKWRDLFSSKEYSIEAIYDKDKISGYYINVKSDTKSIDKNGKGYNAILTLADALGLDINDLEKGMQEAFNENFHDYEDGPYTVRISVISISSTSMSITVENK